MDIFDFTAPYRSFSSADHAAATMPSFAALSDPKAYHLLAYGTLLGSTFFQTFLAGPLAFKALPRPQFSTLQSTVIPVFFALQTALPLALALTWPGQRVLEAGARAGGGLAVRTNAGLVGLLARENWYGALVPVAIMLGTAFVNLVWFGPATMKVMKERKHQETRDGKKYYDPGPKSAEMQRFNKKFATLHGLSSLSDMIGFLAMIYYGFTLAEQL